MNFAHDNYSADAAPRLTQAVRVRPTFETATTQVGVVHLAMRGQAHRPVVLTICGARLPHAVVGYDPDGATCDSCRRRRVSLQRWMVA